MDRPDLLDAEEPGTLPEVMRLARTCDWTDLATHRLAILLRKAHDVETLHRKNGQDARELAGQLGDMLRSSETVTRNVAVLLEAVPEILAEARRAGQAAATKQAAALEEAGSQLTRKVLAEISAAAEAFRASCQREMDRLDARREDVTNAKRALQAEEARVRRELNDARRELTTAQVAFLRQHLKGLSWHHRLFPGGLSDQELERAMIKTK